MPFGERTMPSRRSVVICKPALPGGRFFAIASCDCWRPTSDSNGSRRAILGSLCTGLRSETVLAAGVPAFCFAGAADDLAAGFPTVADFAGAGLAGADWPDAAGLEPVAATA